MQKPPAKFFERWREYWEDPELRPRIMIYGYQVYPIIDTRQTETPEQRMKHPRQLTQVFKISGEEEPWTFEDFCRRVGYGSYRLKMNDQGLKGTQQTWTEAVFDQQYGINDWDKYPAMFDLNWLILDDPRNAPYVRMLRNKNMLPMGGRTEEQEEEDEMATSSVVQELSGTVKDLAGEISRSADKRVEEMKDRGTQNQRPVDIDQQAAVRGLDLVVKAGEMGAKIIDNAVSKSREVAAATANPVEMFDKALVWAEKMSTGKGNGTGSAPALPAAPDPLVTALLGEVTTLRNQLATNQENQIVAMRQEVADLRKAKETPPAAVPPLDPFDFLKKAMGSFKELRAEFGPEDSGAASMAGGMGKYERWMTLGTSLLAGAGDLAGKIAYGIALGKSGAATAPANPGAAPGTVQQQQAAPSLPPGPPRPPLTPEQEAQMQTINSYRPLVALVEAPLLRALDNARSGDEFAQSLIDFYGASAFRAIRDLGATPEERKQNVVVVLSNLSPRLRERMQQAPQQFEQFLDEFLGVDLGGGEEEDDETPEGTTPAA
jgi:hypothetical protein